jgi:cold-inducible RNA-binding protein
MPVRSLRAGRNLELWLPTVGSTSVKASRQALRPRVLRRKDHCQAIVNVKLYVGNLSFSVGDQELREAFSPHGSLLSASVVTDRETGQSRGFGFVEFGSNNEAEAAIAAMNGASLDGRALNVNVAKPREGGDRGGGGGGGGGRGGGGGGRGGGGGGGGRGGGGGGGRGGGGGGGGGNRW